MKIHAAIIDAMRDVARSGIAKTSVATLGGTTVRYRGIEAAMNAMCGVLITHGITVTPSYSDLTIVERAKGDPKDAKATRFATVKGKFTFSAEDGSQVVAEHYGEAMDSGDKAVTKAQSVAFRTALFQQFVIPTMAIDPEGHGEEGDDDIPELLREKAQQGMAAYSAYFASLDKAGRRELLDYHDRLKKIAERADKATA